MIDFSEIAGLLASYDPKISEESSRTRAAVALILFANGGEFNILFLERATMDDDPWSGNIGFPGGKVENGDISPRQTAERETLEEIGLELSTCNYLGRLSDIVGAHLPILVSCFVYGMTDPADFVPNHEVQDIFWISLADLSDPDRNKTAQVRFEGEDFIRPAIRLPQPEKPLLWGITYRFVMEFLELLQGSPAKSNTDVIVQP
jgi:8-oxo-dGTP pyrophosphatase MutT (NUDIX family)